MQTFYSQHGEDRLLSELFRGVKGTCVEVGANDGVTFSNTKYLEQQGWRCILVEPTPWLCEKIRAARSADLYECAASDTDGLVTLFASQQHDLYSSLEQQATMAATLRQSKSVVTPISVRARTLDSILQDANVTCLELVSIDVEGHERAVLAGFNLSRWRPKILIIEDGTDLQVTDVERHMTKNGYTRFYRSGGNDWYARPGEITRGLLFKLLRKKIISSKGLLKANIPRSIIRPILSIRRLILN